MCGKEVNYRLDMLKVGFWLPAIRSKQSQMQTLDTLKGRPRPPAICSKTISYRLGYPEKQLPVARRTQQSDIKTQLLRKAAIGDPPTAAKK